jgi:hypothetical protein
LAGFYIGGHGIGEDASGQCAVHLSGAYLSGIFTGSMDDGHEVNAISGISLGGSESSAPYGGHYGRGEDLLAQSGVDLGIGFQLNYSSGGVGRGEDLHVSSSELLACTHYSLWTGLMSTAWADPANWQCNELPNRYSDVIIPGAAPHFPQVTTGPVEIRNLHLQANSNLQALAGMLRVLGGPQ